MSFFLYLLFSTENPSITKKYNVNQRKLEKYFKSKLTNLELIAWIQLDSTLGSKRPCKSQWISVWISTRQHTQTQIADWLLSNIDLEGKTLESQSPMETTEWRHQEINNAEHIVSEVCFWVVT